LIARDTLIKVSPMQRVLIINPNASPACTSGIDDAVASFRRPGGPVIEVIGTPSGPPAIYTWEDWHAAVGPVCAQIRRSAADIYVIACASDPGIEAARAATSRPVLGIFRAGVGAALTVADRFGVVSIVSASRARHLLALRTIGADGRLAADVAMDVSMETLLDPDAARAGLIRAAGETVAAGAGAVVLGCTGMAHHRAAVEDAVGVPVIEPCAAAAALSLAMLSGAGR
jgi:allantoin racemase